MSLDDNVADDPAAIYDKLLASAGQIAESDPRTSQMIADMQIV